MTCVQLRTETRTSISRQNLLCKLGISNSLCSRTVKFTIFKKQIKARGTHTPTHDPPSPRTSWMYDHCRAVPSQQLSYKCVVWRCHLKHSPRQERDFYTRVFPGHWPMAIYAMLISPSEGETAVHGCHCPRDMAVRMREVMAMGWCMCAPCLKFALFSMHSN